MGPTVMLMIIADDLPFDQSEGLIRWWCRNDPSQPDHLTIQRWLNSHVAKIIARTRHSKNPHARHWAPRIYLMEL
jgi:hypothetical protein